MKEFLGILIFFSVLLYISGMKVALNINGEWTYFKKYFRKNYSNYEDESRRKYIFTNILSDVAAHNNRYKHGQEIYKKAVYSFHDLTDAEMVKYRKGLVIPRWKKKTAQTQKHKANAAIISPLPASINWVKKGVVTPVKDQGFCGACWAFAVNSAIQSQILIDQLDSSHAKIDSKFLDLSEQSLVDCARSEYGCFGCNGGWPYGAFEFAIEQELATESAYPYKSFFTSTRYKCRLPIATHNMFSITDQTNPDGDLYGNEEVLKSQLVLGPVVVLITANQNFVAYDSGIFSDLNCKNSPVDHVVLLVGYDTTSQGIPYWLIKNSWGEEWGESGYIRMIRNGNNTCNIALYGSVPII